MKVTLIILSFIIGGYMLFDGIYVLVKGKFFGHDKPGPWAFIAEKAGIDPFKTGPAFICFGILWLVLIVASLTNASWTFWYGIILCIFSLWYLLAGTFISLIVALILIIYRNELF